MFLVYSQLTVLWGATFDFEKAAKVDYWGRNNYFWYPLFRNTDAIAIFMYLSVYVVPLEQISKLKT